MRCACRWTGRSRIWTRCRCSYSVYRKDGPNASFAKVATVGVPSYDATGLQAGGTYVFKVEAEDGGGNESSGGPVGTVAIPASNAGGSFYEPFDSWATGAVSNGGEWTYSAANGTSVQIAELTQPGGKALRITDSYYDAANPYAETPFVRRSTTPLTGKVTMDATVVFRTVPVKVQLKDSLGNPLDGGVVTYYAGSWRAFGVTSAGESGKELLGGSYSFRVVHGGSNSQKTQNTAEDPIVVFQL